MCTTRKMNQLTDLKMAVDATFSSIISEIQLSNLNFSLQITPFSAYITLKKSVIKDQNGVQAVPSPPILFLLQQAHQKMAELREETEQLKIKLDAAEKKNDILVNDNAVLAEVIAVSNNNLEASNATNNALHAKLEEAEKQVLEISSAKSSSEACLKDTKKSLQHEINNANTVIKSLEKGSKALEKENHNLKRNLESARDTIKNLKNENSSLKINKSKLETEMKKLEKVISKKESKIAKLVKKDINQNNLKLEDSATSFSPSSLCSSTSSRSSASLTGSYPPFTSMISHWSPLPAITPQMPNSITSMVTHGVRLPPPSCSLVSKQEFQEMMERIFEKAFSNFRWNPIDEQINL